VFETGVTTSMKLC